MRYFITVTLSQHDVTLKYYRDDDGINRLLPFKATQWPAPLAVHIAEEGVVVGKDALDRFEVSQPNTFYNLFSLINTGDTYKRFGLNKNTSHLIYLAVDTLLDQLMPSQLNLTLADNRRSIPIAFNFTPDVTKDERRHVVDLFLKGDGEDCGGYGNVGVIDIDSQLARLALSENHRNYALVLHTNRQNLTATLYSKADPANCIGSAVMKDLGADRRIMNGVNEIKAYVSSKNPNIDFEPIEERLEKIVEEFIASGKMEMSSKVVINSEPYRFFLSVDDLKANSAAAERQFIAQHLRQFLHNNSVHPDDTVMVLASSKLQNDYFLPLFREYFESVYCVTEQQTERMQQEIIDAIVKSDYTFSEAENLLKSLREQWAQISSFIRNMQIPAKQFDAALEDITDFVAQVKRADIPDEGREKLIADAQRMAEKVRNARDADRQQEPPRVRVTDEATATPPDYFKQLIDSVMEELNQYVGEGNFAAAQTSYNDLITELRAAGVEHRYADILQRMNQLSTPQPKREPRVNVPPVYPSDSPLQVAIAQRDFRKARKICMENDDVDNYPLMKELEDGCKKFVVAEKYMDRYVAEQNHNAIERAIRELTEYASLLDTVRSPHPEVDTLLAKYKQLK